MARGGKREGAGRPKGSRNAATKDQIADLASAARGASHEALAALISIAKGGQSEAARVSAATAILDRGFGKPVQAMEHTGKDGGPIQTEDITKRDADAFTCSVAGLVAGQRAEPEASGA